MTSNGMVDMSERVRLITKDDLQHVDWGDNNHYQREFLTAILETNTKEYFTNIETDTLILQADTIFMPVTVNNAEYNNCYVCSPFTAYVSYLLDELILIESAAIRWILSLFVKTQGVFLKKTKINKIVHVNNWLLSTNLYDDHVNKYLPEITKLLIEKFPDHAIAFRSLNENTNQTLLTSCKDNYYTELPSRIVYISNGRTKDFLKSRDMKQDIKDLNSSIHNISHHDDITERDYKRIVQLYNMLYIDKYSDKNVQFTEKFISLCHRKKLLIMNGLRNSDGELIGIMGSFIRNGVLTTPLLGYDLTLPTQQGLYRLLSAMIQLLAIDNSAICNNSSGVGKFKRLRGAIPYTEYSMIYLKHLSWWRRLPWHYLRFLTIKIIAPFVRRNEL